ncbi:MAG TPA: phenylalanine--tRNA ligase subunit beta [Planctomycetota bacterium]|nr:phenylalanine--tRNA ligase subunit beta [Planctomycetota bacterium]
MKLSLKWLGEHVDLAGVAPDDVARELTMKTALIEDVVRHGAGLEQVRVGLVVHREKHPNADRLSFCKVDAGSGVVEVVCGAPNVAQGQKICYAPVGCTLPNGLTLEARKIRGVLSHGMICSNAEMKLGEDHDGIRVLPEDAPVGRPIAEVLGLDDAILDIDNKSITHRPDLWGHYGFARELAAIFGRTLKALPVDAGLKRAAPGPGTFPIALEDAAGCPLYLALQVEYETLPASPDWLARRLEAVGMRPISLLVDLSNYVMLETGQPTHPFDADRLEGGRIVVRRATPGEKLATLDGVARTLTAEDVVIADGAKAVAIAGVMGGAPTEVSASTRRLLLESARFDAARVRRTATRLGLRTEAVARFEKGLDPALPELAIRRYAQLLKQIAPGVRVRGGFSGAGEPPPPPAILSLRPARARSKLGYDLPTDEMKRRLASIGFEASGSGERLDVRPPTGFARRDVACEDDLIEEVGRLAGYERVPASLPRLQCAPPRLDPLRRVERAALRTLVHECGYAECMNYSFATDRQIEREGGAAAGAKHVRLLNSLTTNATRLRRSLVPGLLEFLQKNLVDHEEVRLVEAGREYLPELPSEYEGAGLPRERRVVAAVRARRGADGEALLLEARGDAEVLLARLGVAWRGRRPEGALPPFLHPGRTIELVADGQAVGRVAALHPGVARNFGIEAPACVLELDLAAATAAPRPPARMRPISEFPPARRDLAVESPEERTVADVEKEIRAAGGETLADVGLFDVYRGANLAAGHRSLAFRLEYRAADRTLTDAEVDAIHQKVVERLAKLGIRLRA